MYKIAIVGSQSTGKSCLAKELSKILNIHMISEIARRWDIEKATQTELIDIQNEVLKLQIEEERKHEQFISDRSTIDNLAYWLHNVYDIVDYEENFQYKNKALSNVGQYSHIFLLTPEFYPVNDGFRNTDVLYQMRIDATIQTILHLYDIPHYRLSGTVENRIKEAMKILENF